MKKNPNMKKFKQILILSLAFTSLADIGFAKSKSLTLVNQANMWTNDHDELRSLLGESPDVVNRLKSGILLK